MYYFYTAHEYSEEKLILNTGSSYNKMLPSIDLNEIVIAKQNQIPLYKGFAYPKTHRDNFTFTPEHPFQKFNKDVYYYHILADTIWQIKDSICNAAYALNFLGRGDIYRNIDMNKFNDFDYKNLEKNKIRFHGNYLMLKDYLYLGMVDKTGGIVPMFYSKTSKIIKYGMPISNNKKILINYLFGNAVDFCLSDDLFVKVLQPYLIKQTCSSLSEKNLLLLSKNEQEFIKSINDQDNPILLTFTLKKF